MTLNVPLLLSLTTESPTYRWRLVTSLYRSAEAIVEGTLALLLVLAVCYFRTRAPIFLYFGVVGMVIVAVRLWDRGRFLRRTTGDEAGIESVPEFWALRHAAISSATALVWGATDFCALTFFDDQSMQFFVLMIQSGWLSGSCVRSAASPAALAAQAVMTLIPTEAGLLLTRPGLVQLAIPIGFVQLSSLLRHGRSLGAQLKALLESEQQVDGVNKKLTATNARLAEANARLTQLAETDGMTGLANRHAFDAALKVEWSRAQRDASELGLMMIDVDFFKLFNDRYGHLSGDDCLRSVALLVAGSLQRPADLAARYGGEEFVALLPGVDELGARAVAERLRRAVAAADLPHQAAPLGHVSVSVGVASFAPTHLDTPDTLIQRADRALYQAKSKGRNRVCAAGEELEVPAFSG